jgi:hypothetical protein
MITRNYAQLAEAWGIPVGEIKAARTKLGDRLVEGEHYERGDQNALFFTAEGEALLLQEMGLEPPAEELSEEQFNDFLAQQSIAQLAPAIALRAYKMLPGLVAQEMRRMLHAPRTAEEVAAVGNALSAYASAMPGFLPGGQP